MSTVDRWLLRALLVLLTLVVVVGCAPAGTPDDRAAPSPDATAVSTLTPVPLPPDPPPSGRLVADLRQSSRDAALGRLQVWVDNDTRAALVPTRITYRDPRLGAPLAAGRLRALPAGSERGFTLDLPARPRCATVRGRGTLEVGHAGRRTTVPVDDPVDLVGRWVRTRCFEREVAEVATLRWSDRVVGDGGPTRPGDTAALTLVVTPTGARGRRLEVLTVGGTPTLSPADGASAWSPLLRVRGEDPPVRVPLRVRPARCDPHAFLESGGATAFRVRLRLDGEPGELVLRMQPTGAAAALAFAVASCGLGGRAG